MNHPWFIAMIAVCTVNHVIWLGMVGHYLFYAPGRGGLNLLGVASLMESFTDRFIFYYVLVSVTQLIGEVVLLYIQAKQATRGQTMSDAFYSSSSANDHGHAHGAVEQWHGVRPRPDAKLAVSAAATCC